MYFDGIESEIDCYRKALESISKNSCCSPCQEAARVAQEALKPKRKAEKVIEGWLWRDFGGGWIFKEKPGELEGTVEKTIGRFEVEE